jgi:hypothetical protein
MVPFGTTGYIEKKFDKNSIERARKVTFIGYPDDTKGWTFADNKGKIHSTRNARFIYQEFYDRTVSDVLRSSNKKKGMALG